MKCRAGITKTVMSENIIALTVDPTLDSDKISDKAWYIALDDCIVAHYNVLLRPPGLIMLVGY